MRKGMLALAVMLWIAGPATAEQILHFVNGTNLPIRSYTEERGMYRVDLGGNGFMAFPAYLVDRIEYSDRVRLPQSTQSMDDLRRGSTTMQASGVAVPEDPHLAREQQRQQRQQAKLAARKAAEEALPTEEGGLAVQRQYAGSGHAAKRRIATVGGRGALAQGNRRGGKVVLNGDDARPRIVTGISAVGAGRPDVPMPPPPATGTESAPVQSTDGGSGQDSSDSSNQN